MSDGLQHDIVDRWLEHVGGQRIVQQQRVDGDVQQPRVDRDVEQ